MNVGIRLEHEPLRVVNHLTIHNAGAGVYVSVDAAHPVLLHPSRMLLIQNFTNADLMISTNGIDDAFPIASGSFILLDITSNRSDIGKGYYIAEGTRFYVAQIEDPTAGDLYLTSFYAAE